MVKSFGSKYKALSGLSNLAREFQTVVKSVQYANIKTIQIKYNNKKKEKKIKQNKITQQICIYLKQCNNEDKKNY